MAGPYFEPYYLDKSTLWKRASLQGRPAGRSTTRLRGASAGKNHNFFTFYFGLHDFQRLGRRLPLRALALSP